MTRILAEISVSLDGFVTGPDPGPDNGLGTGGEAQVLRDRLRDAGLRCTVAEGADGRPSVLVFRADAERARSLVGP